jgi:hypothetical protein
MSTEVNIGEVSANLHTMDSSAPLSRAQLLEVARIVAALVREENQHQDRAAGERRITQGVSAERDADSEN